MIFDNKQSTGSIVYLISELIVFFLVILSIVAFSITTQPNLDPVFLSNLRILEIVLIYFFAIEYCIRIYVAKAKLKYIFSFYGIVDLLAFLPFLIFEFVGSEVFRVLRIFHILRLLKIFEVSNAFKLFYESLGETKRDMVSFAMLLIIIIYMISILFFFIENSVNSAVNSVFDAFWFVVITVTTVGFGDIVPVTVWGRLLSFFAILIGVLIIVFPISILTAAITRKNNELSRRNLRRAIETDIKDEFSKVEEALKKSKDSG